MFMGRTNPTYRMKLQNQKRQWKTYRRGLRRQDKKYFDRLFEHAENKADAAGLQNHRNHMISILFSICLEQEKQIKNLQKKIEKIEE